MSMIRVRILTPNQPDHFISTNIGPKKNFSHTYTIQHYSTYLYKISDPNPRLDPSHRKNFSDGGSGTFFSQLFSFIRYVDISYYSCTRTPGTHRKNGDKLGFSIKVYTDYDYS